MANEVVIDGKLMSIGSKSWRPEVYQINYGAELGPHDPGSDNARIGQTFANRGPGSGNYAQGHPHTQTTVDMGRMGQNMSPEGQAMQHASSSLHRNGMLDCLNTEELPATTYKKSSVMKMATKVMCQITYILVVFC